ncbi:hypothetical protein ZEAMMB73_Zm00001d016238 [Zea mays]|uniref:Uncharacterized protein n=1 Tax=Zea mays TaxID=4577 RepID=A0A1D6H6E0_MAIZE|nr:hypothetical protein ZEAMMB73_Zm00001d016238 [Zea mays]AQK70357.1 hypothetical protein ZEAMMB73_Zm00001d016238 [Zea mays]AQK70359.1 hypothetical protein ZEAMMB73_Zm00001d016238 [Zea mays]AQK70361.1 hypothetical protein ZEAMMB73_Zm00001d016238 [Zea mays]AQK70366.1 hypothetical protein ZEAMMB73_Zm00001d016238 [Zea mays]
MRPCGARESGVRRAALVPQACADDAQTTPTQVQVQVQVRIVLWCVDVILLVRYVLKRQGKPS